MKENTLVRQLFDTQADWGHKKQFRNPKLKTFIYKTVNKLDVINLDYTALQIEQAKTIINQYHKEDILIISSRNTSFNDNEKVDVIHKWKPGMLTNFKFSPLTKMPKLLIVEQANRNNIALKEANICGIKTIALCDTNSSLTDIDYFIVMNDDNSKATQLVINYLFQ